MSTTDFNINFYPNKIVATGRFLTIYQFLFQYQFLTIYSININLP